MTMSKLQEKIVKSKEEKIVVIAAAASGKALKNGSVVFTENGSKSIENLLVGDKIFGEDGQLHSVIGIYPQGRKQIYKVSFSDRTTIECCNEHLWTFQTESLRSKKSKTWLTKTLQEIIDEYPIYKDARAKNNFGSTKSKRKNLFIPMTQPINFKEQIVPLDAYVLGALLGDGHLGRAGEMSIFTNQDEDILELVNTGLKEINCNLQHKRNFDYSIKQNTTAKKGQLTTILEELKLDGSNSSNKFIPDIYKYNSVKIRYAILQGLIDTDGYCEGSSYDLTLKSKQLILDVKFICESLGLTAVYQEKQAVCTNSPTGRKDCGTVYRLRIKTSKLFPKLHLSNRREQQWKPSKVYAHRAITNIEKLDEYEEMTCIQVDNPTKLFITDNFIVTHNTAILTERVKWLLRNGADPSKMVVFTFTNAAAEEMRGRIGEEGRRVFIDTIHSYAYALLLKNGVDMGRAIDEANFDEFFHKIQQNPSAIEEVEHLLLDEAQDSNLLQYQFILDMIKPKNLFIVGDFRQSIYEFNGGRPDILLDLAMERGFASYDLNENYRNGPSILNFAKGLISGSAMGDYSLMDSSMCMNEFEKDLVAEVQFDAKDVVRRIKETGEYKDWFVLTRSNAQADILMGILEKAEIPCDTFKRAGLSSSEFSERMRANTVKVLTIHSAKGLEADNVIVVGASKWSKKGEERRVSYVAATRARKQLIWTKSFKRKPKISKWE